MDDAIREHYLRGDRSFPIGKMTGEMPDLLRMAISYKQNVGFVLSMNRKPLWGMPLEFNDFTGRLIVKIGAKGKSPYVNSFLIKHVKEFQFSWELWEEYLKVNK